MINILKCIYKREELGFSRKEMFGYKTRTANRIEAWERGVTTPKNITDVYQIYLKKLSLTLDDVYIYDPDNKYMNVHNELLRTYIEETRGKKFKRINENASGISYRKEPYNDWVAYLSYQGKQIILGYRDKEEEAVELRKQGIKQYNELINKELEKISIKPYLDEFTAYLNKDGE